MTKDLLEDINHIPDRDWRPVWSDFLKIRYLRLLICATEARLEDLRTNQAQNNQMIACEEATLASIRKELKVLEQLLLMV